MVGAELKKIGREFAVGQKHTSARGGSESRRRRRRLGGTRRRGGRGGGGGWRELRGGRTGAAVHCHGGGR